MINNINEIAFIQIKVESMQRSEIKQKINIQGKIYEHNKGDVYNKVKQTAISGYK